MQEAQRAIQALNPLDRAVFALTRGIIGNRRARSLFIIYAATLVSRAVRECITTTAGKCLLCIASLDTLCLVQYDVGERLGRKTDTDKTDLSCTLYMHVTVFATRFPAPQDSMPMIFRPIIPSSSSMVHIQTIRIWRVVFV